VIRVVTDTPAPLGIASNLKFACRIQDRMSPLVFLPEVANCDDRSRGRQAGAVEPPATNGDFVFSLPIDNALAGGRIPMTGLAFGLSRPAGAAEGMVSGVTAR
jgi:hypothetical protein